MQSDVLTPLFLYGTLKRGQARHGLVAGQQFLGEAETEPRYLLLDCGAYPCLVECVDGERGVAVRGEVWAVDERTIARLDEYEGVPVLYRRVAVALTGWPVTSVMAYFYAGDHSGFAECGTEWPGR